MVSYGGITAPHPHGTVTGSQHTGPSSAFEARAGIILGTFAIGVRRGEACDVRSCFLALDKNSTRIADCRFLMRCGLACSPFLEARFRATHGQFWTLIKQLNTKIMHTNYISLTTHLYKKCLSSLMWTFSKEFGKNNDKMHVAVDMWFCGCQFFFKKITQKQTTLL